MILGMGGSAISGLLIKEILNNEINIPIYVNQNYIVPKWVNKKTLIIASSYSGNTEETLISCKECIKKKCKIIGVSTGGDLLKLLKINNYNDLVLLPKGLQPRAALGYSFSLIMLLLNKLKFINKNIIDDLKKSIKPLLVQTKENSDFKNKNNSAYSIALKIYWENPNYICPRWDL